MIGLRQPLIRALQALWALYYHSALSPGHNRQLPYLPPPVSAGPEEGCSFKAWHRARHTGDPQDMVIVGKSSVERFKVSLKGVVSNCVPGTSAGSDFYR